MSMYDIQERPLEPPPDPTLVCSHCGEPFLYGYFIFRDGTDTFCLDCFLYWVYDLLETSPAEIAERLGFDVEKQGKE